MKQPVGRRLGDRVPTKIAADIFGDAGIIGKGEIRDISSSGARLEIPWGTELPPRFHLRYGRDQKVAAVELVWRKGFDMAVRFVQDLPLAEVVPAARPVPQVPKLSMMELRRMVAR